VGRESDLNTTRPDHRPSTLSILPSHLFFYLPFLTSTSRPIARLFSIDSAYHIRSLHIDRSHPAYVFLSTPPANALDNLVILHGRTHTTFVESQRCLNTSSAVPQSVSNHHLSTNLLFLAEQVGVTIWFFRSNLHLPTDPYIYPLRTPSVPTSVIIHKHN
jgi:hypothetical protein